jgi:hypothetical protein
MLIKPIQEETVETNTAQNNGQAGAGNTKPNGDGKRGKKDVPDELIEEARRLALQNVAKEDDRRILSSASMEMLRELIAGGDNGGFSPTLFEQGLLLNKDGKAVPTFVGRLFIKSYRFVREARRGG